jgi:predicted GNAT family acetyltransferase
VEAFHHEVGMAVARDVAVAMARARLAEGGVRLWEDGQPVSMAMATRPTRRGVAVTWVYTPRHARRRGYASNCVAALCRELLTTGHRFCVLFADLANPTSNHIYRSIGFRPVADYAEFDFHAP